LQITANSQHVLQERLHTKNEQQKTNQQS